MIKRCILVSLLLLMTSLAAHARELVVVFENSLQPSTSLDAMARSQMLMRNLAMAEVPQAMFLIKPRALDNKDKARLQLYSDRGHLLVNAGYNHSLVSKSDLYAYEVGILKANRLLSPYSGYRQHLHFSYLHEQGDSAIQRSLIGFVKMRGYRPAFTTYNPWRGVDAYLNQLYQARIKLNRPVNMAALESAYVELLAQTLVEQDALAFNLLGYSPPQTLVLQENDLAAYFVVALLDELIARGWQLISAQRLVDAPIANPLFSSGWGANSFWPAVTGLPDIRVAYPRTLGERKTYVDNFLQSRVPGLLEH
ncbi:hypothetical protein O59_004221 [Cellvibrio sp. BR]|uniref:hypothetical protein n=1 Tax=Cellvibrio sp. BR TaxID=1134474 RepID=UPI00026009A1|nr:hypothetical protein [Cellvibrio sp. BR]EIK43117.1 hypothetical protein O59_004221 [Cellvibrio sp. BR]